jgi:hypothetical protein
VEGIQQMTTPGKAGAAPSLSELRAQLRRGSSTSAPPVESRGENGQKRGINSEDTADTPPKKRVAIAPSSSQPPKAAVTKAPGKLVSGLSAKMPGQGSTLPPTDVSSGTGLETIEGDLVSAISKSAQFQKAATPSAPSAVSKKAGATPSATASSMVKRPAVAPPFHPQPPPQKIISTNDSDLMPPPDGSANPAAINDLVAAIEASPTGAKQRHVIRLAEAIGQSLQIEYINHFLKALRTKILERAKKDGVQVPTVATSKPISAPGSPAVPKLAVAKTVAVPATTTKPAASPPIIKATPSKPTIQNASKPNSVAPDSPTEAEDLPMASPPASPPPDDALYNLVGEFTEDPVFQAGSLRETRLLEVFKRLWGGVARKPKDWAAAWQAMGIPVDKQAEALQRLLNMAFVQTEDPERAPLIVAELVKAHKVRMRSVEEVLINFGHNLDGILALNEDAWHVYAKFLVHVFPKPALAGWGWSRVGWSWQSWWQFAEKCIHTLEPSRAFDVLGLILRLIQDKEGQPLSQLQAWTDGDKFGKVLSKLCELGSCEQAEVVDRLNMLGVVAMDDAAQEEA